MPRPGRWVLASVPCVLAALLVAGCTGDPGAPSPSAGQPSAGGADAAPTLPDGVRVAVEQTRTDLGGRRVQLRLHNGSDEVVTVTGASLVSPRLVAPAVWRSSSASVVDAGLDRDLAVEVGRTRCGGATDARVSVAFTTADGAAGEAVLGAPDRFGSVRAFLDRDCARTRTEALAAVDVRPGLAVSGRGRGSVARLVVGVVPTDPDDPDDSLVLRRVAGTVLLGPPEGDAWELDREVVPGEGATTVVLPVVPARCDPHALAEDKVGTLFALTTEVDGTAGTYYLDLREATRGRLFAFVAEHCGYPG